MRDVRARQVIAWGLAALFAVLGVMQARVILAAQPAGIDFLPLWTAGRMAASAASGQVYDFAAVSRAQAWLLPHLVVQRPFAYPPSALLILAPLGRAPFWIALALWVGASFAVFLAAAARLCRERPWLAVALTAVCPPVVLAALTGQSVVLVAGLAAFGVMELKARPFLAGALFALAGAIKPQALVLLPVALLAARSYRPIASGAAVAVALAAISAVVFGPERWAEWIAALPRFQAVIEGNPSLVRGVIAPAILGVELRLPPVAGLAWRAALTLAAIAAVWRAFAGTRDAAPRLASLMVGALFIAPYAMHYEATLLAPAAAAALAAAPERPRWLLPLAAYLAAACAAIAHVGPLAVIAFMALAAASLTVELPGSPIVWPARGR